MVSKFTLVSLWSTGGSAEALVSDDASVAVKMVERKRMV